MTDKEIAAFKKRMYYAANKEVCLRAMRKWEAKNPNYRKEYYQRNKERIKAYNSARYQRNKALLAQAKAVLANA